MLFLVVNNGEASVRYYEDPFLHSLLTTSKAPQLRLWLPACSQYFSDCKYLFKHKPFASIRPFGTPLQPTLAALIYDLRITGMFPDHS